jgi:hypothetical protein
MKKGDVVTVMTSIGEYVAKFVKLDETGVHVDDPRLIVKGQDGNIGFGRGVCMSAVENVPELVFRDCIFVAKTNESFERAYIEATSGIIV